MEIQGRRLACEPKEEKTMRMKLNWFKRKKVNPFITPKDITIFQIAQLLFKWNLAERDEILTAVLKRVFPDKTHLHKNRKCKAEKREAQAA